MNRKPLVEVINEELDHWTQEEYHAQQRLEFCQRQLDRLLGEKTLRLIQGGRHDDSSQ